MKNGFRRFMSVAILAALLSLSCGYALCEETTKSLYAQGMELVQLMSEMTRSEEYVGLFTGNSEIRSKIEAISTGDFTTPKAVYALSIPSEELAQLVGLDDLNGISEGLQAFLMQRMLIALVTQLNGLDGAETLAAASLCTIEKSFVNENIHDHVIYLYTFDEAVPVAVTFTVGEDHTVCANGMFILHDGFSYSSAEQIQSIFSDIPMEITLISEEE